MAETNAIANLNGLHKSVFGEKLEKAVPVFARAQKAIPWDEDASVGKEYKFPVILVSESGITCSEPEDTGFDLQPPITGIIKEATLKPYAHCSRAKIAYSAAFQAGAGDENSKRAYAAATGVVIQNLIESQRRMVEAHLLGHGRDGYEIDDVTANVITFTDADWAAGVWVGRLGAKLEIFSSRAESSTKRAGAGSDALGTGYYTIAAIDIANKQITLDDDQNVQNGDFVYFRTEKTASLYKTMVGLKQIIGNAGQLFGIDGSTYELFSGNTYPVGGNLSVPDILAAMALAAPKGGSGEFELWTSPTAYSVLNGDVSSLVQFDGTKASKYVLGTDSLQIRGSTGVVTVSSHEMMKDGEALLWQPRVFLRSGTTDVTMDRSKINGGKKFTGDFFREVDGAAAFETRCWDSMFLASAYPGRGVLMSEIDNS